MKNPIRYIKQAKTSKAIRKLQATVPDIKNLPKDVVLSQFANQMKLRQQEWTQKGSPITNEEMETGIRKDWKITKVAYMGAGITLDELIETGKEAIKHPEEAIPLPKPVQWIVNKTGRNAVCPCGSGKKYKKCCGKG